MSKIFLIMSGLNSCPDCDQIHGFETDEAEANKIVADLNADQEKLKQIEGKFFVADVVKWDGLLDLERRRIAMKDQSNG